MTSREYQARTLSGAQAEVRRCRAALRRAHSNIEIWLTQRNDAALVARALCMGAARWEPWTGADGRGELCVGGLRYSTVLNRLGVPDLSANMRAAIKEALKG